MNIFIPFISTSLMVMEIISVKAYNNDVFTIFLYYGQLDQRIKVVGNQNL